MTIPPRDELARLLGGEHARPAHGWVSVPEGAPVVTVEGYGTVKLSIARPQALKLRALGEPAPYGQGEETLTDASVRHTWLIPGNLVSVDWGEELGAVLESTRSALGLPPTTELTAEFHSMLVYEVGQFFLPHQDSEKHDDMVATLVVVLPSAHSGGELVVHGEGREAAYPGSRHRTTAVALYADQVHEVRPVRTGHRISLTYNIFARQRSIGAGAGDLIGQAAELIDRHFAHRPEPRWKGQTPEQPVRLAFLLDHQYSERSLAWERLKGVDIERAAALRVAGDIAGCEISLGLLDIQETHNADSSSDDFWRDEDFWGDGDDREVRPTGTAQERDRPINTDVSLTHWLSRDADAAQRVDLILADDELCATTPTHQLRPYQSEFEGYMGNYGNTMDRWYHRAAVLIWPRPLAFANRASMDGSWALDDLCARLRDGERASVRDDLAGLESLWPSLVRGPSGIASLDQVIEIATLVDDEALARMLLAPYGITAVTPAVAKAVGGLADAYDEAWVRDRLADWFGNPSRPDRGLDAWLARLPEVVAEFRGRPGLASEVLRQGWARMTGRVEAHRTMAPSSWVRAQREALADPLSGILKSAAAQEDSTLLSEVAQALTADDTFLPEVIAIVLHAQSWPDVTRRGLGDDLSAYVIGHLHERLARPARQPDDWSIRPPRGCDCHDCGQLAEFLTDPVRRVHEWPLAESRRAHIHSIIEGADLPVTHQTRRTGRPYTLVLTKTKALFTREAAGRVEDDMVLRQLLTEST